MRGISIYWRLSNLYFWFFALLGGLLPYWSLYLEGQGFSYLQIATLMATIQLTKIVAPSVWGWLGDRTGQRVRLVRFGAITGSLFFAGVFMEPGFYGLLLVMLAFTFFWNAILPLYEVITLRTLGEQKEKYGRVRLWGSVGFIGAVALVGGLLELVPIQNLPWLLLPVFAGIAVSAFLVPAERGERKPPAPKGSLKAIVTHPAVVTFFLMNFLLQVSHGAYYTFFSIHLEQHGYGKLSIGLLWSLGVFAEIALFLVMHRLTRNFTVRPAASCSILRCAACNLCPIHPGLFWQAPSRAGAGPLQRPHLRCWRCAWGLVVGLPGGWVQYLGGFLGWCCRHGRRNRDHLGRPSAAASPWRGVKLRRFLLPARW